MSITTHVLSSDQRAFLETHFVVYDPLTRTYSRDFSRLEHSQVVLMGNIHVSQLLRNIQTQFLTKIIGNQSACLFAEGLSPGQCLQARDLPGWHYLPESLKIRGADIRFENTDIQFIEMESLVKSLLKLRLEDREHVSDAFRQLAKIFNSCSPRKVAPNRFRISEETFQAIATQYDSLLQKQILRFEEMLSLDKQKLSLAQRKGDLRLVESNRGLLQEIEKASQQFSRIIAIWGTLHFNCDDELISGLGKAQLSYVILLPKQCIATQAFEENRWNPEKIQIVELHLLSRKEQMTLRVPKIFYPYFSSL